MVTLSELIGLRCRFGLCGALVLGLGTAAAIAAGPPLRIEWSVNGGNVNVFLPSGFAVGLGTFGYEGTTTDKATGVVLSYDVTVDPYESIGGTFEVYNHRDTVIDIALDVVLPFTPVFVKGSELRGDVTIGLNTDTGGGMISSLPPYLWQAMIDEAVVGPSASLFYDPFFMSAGGQAGATTQADFGSPSAVAGPPISESIGYRLSYSLTPLDLASIASNFSSSGNPLTCMGDLNTSGSVGSEDLFLLLANWGPCDSPICDADLDGNVDVGIVDLLIMLASWGPCQ